jgi:hypothetical protein
MSIATLTPPLQLEDVEYRKDMSGGLTQPKLVDALDNHERYTRVVLKLKNPGPPIGRGHFAGTSLACELICAVLARALGLNVPDYAIVKVTRDFANSVPDKSIRHLLMKNIGENFGSVHNPFLALWNARYVNRSQVLLNQLEDILTFDAVIINADRSIFKPNLMYRGDLLVPIDHSLALTVHLWEQEMLHNLPLLPQEAIRRHCAGQLLKGKNRLYRRILDNWQERINSQELDELREMLPCCWEYEQDDIDKIFRFLKSRDLHFTDISTHLMGVLS